MISVYQDTLLEVFMTNDNININNNAQKGYSVEPVRAGHPRNSLSYNLIYQSLIEDII